MKNKNLLTKAQKTSQGQTAKSKTKLETKRILSLVIVVTLLCSMMLTPAIGGIVSAYENYYANNEAEAVTLEEPEGGAVAAYTGA